MKKNRILSAFLCVVMLASAMCLPAYANGLTIVGKAKTTDGLTIVQNYDTAIPLGDDDGSDGDENEGGGTPDPGNPLNSGMVLNKTATANTDGTYTITLEAYATGSKVTTSVNRDKPTDIILVLDQSGSMAESFSTTTEDSWSSYGKRKNSENYDDRMNANYGDKNLYYQLADGNYVEVSVTYERGEETFSYSQAGQYSNYNTMFYNSSETYYALDSDGNYYSVRIEKSSSGSGFDRKNTYTYSYTKNDGTTVSKTSDGDYGEPPFALYRRSSTYEYVYKYYYTVSGVETVITTSTGQNTVCDTVFYKKIPSGTSISKLESLKSAVQAFADGVAEKAKGADGQLGTEDDVDHRIAIVGFGSDSRSSYTNSELFIGETQYNYNETQISGMYGSALQDMTTATGVNNINASISALDANGGTAINLGTKMANSIFAAYKNEAGNSDRAKVVIVFTDGLPGIYNSDSDSTRNEYANGAIADTKIAKGTYGATVYTVGIFDGANGSTPGSLTTKTSWGTYINYRDEFNADADVANKFMHLLSSNYPNAESMTEHGTMNSNLNGKSYYLSASGTSALNNIFQQIAEEVETGGTTTTLNSSTVIKDIIAPQFQLPEGATADDITLETYRYTGVNTWTKNDTAMGATATVGTGGTVNVTGFDFSENWCGTETTDGSITYRGNKLVISFTVKTKDGFLGGNDVYTNTSAGVYENSTATEPVLTFPKPTVNVPIGNVTVTAAEKNVYLLGSLTAEQIKSGATAKCGGVTLDLSEADYGLESWQYEYVNITVAYTDASGNTITNLSDLEDDTTYTVTVTVAPKTNGDTTNEGTVATTKNGIGKGKINVFKPELTFKDSDIYYGDTAPTSYDGNKTGEVWKHGSTVSTDTGVTMIGNKPTLSLTYTPDSTKISDGKINTKGDIYVDVAVKIGITDVTDKTTFVHTKCNSSETDPTDGKFWLHVKTCQLTIEKTGGASDESYVFDVYKDGVKYTEITVWGNGSETIYELPVGTYSIVENTGWSWRYTPSYSARVALSSANTSGTITCTNTSKTNQWLNGFSTIVKNIFGVKN